MDTNLIAELTRVMAQSQSAAGPSVVALSAQLLYALFGLAIASIAASVASFMKAKENASNIALNAALAKVAAEQSKVRLEDNTVLTKDVLGKVNGNHTQMENKITALQEDLQTIRSLYAGVKGEQAAKDIQEGTLAQLIRDMRENNAKSATPTPVEIVGPNPVPVKIG